MLKYKVFDKNDNTIKYEYFTDSICRCKLQCTKIPIKKEIYMLDTIIEKKKEIKIETCPPIDKTCVSENNYLKKKQLVCYPYKN